MYKYIQLIILHFGLQIYYIFPYHVITIVFMKNFPKMRTKNDKLHFQKPCFLNNKNCPLLLLILLKQNISA